MKAAVLTLDGFVIEEVDLPEIGPQEVLIRTLSCGICSGDLFVYQNRPDFVSTYNRLGHEASGEIVAVGREVDHLVPGDIVTSLALPAYAEIFVAAADRVVKLPPEVDPNYALGEAIACCVHAANRFGTRPGDKVAVIGLGFMGQICLQLAKVQGAGFICAVDPIEERQNFSRRFGADVVYNPFETAGQEILDLHGEFDIVIEAAGVQGAVDLATDLVALHGRIILVGYHQSNNGVRSVNMERWNFKAIDVVNGHVRREDEKVEAMRQGIELMQQGQLLTEPLVTLYDFAEIESAFQALDNRKPGLLKASLVMS